MRDIDSSDGQRQHISSSHSMHILTGVGTADGLKIGATLGIGVGIYTNKGHYESCITA